MFTCSAFHCALCRCGGHGVFVRLLRSPVYANAFAGQWSADQQLREFLIRELNRKSLCKYAHPVEAGRVHFVVNKRLASHKMMFVCSHKVTQGHLNKKAIHFDQIKVVQTE